jgi:GNAT superfamily N-acetyltransferase
MWTSNGIMMSIEPFAHKHIEDSAKLFISSYKNQRENVGCLPSNYEKLETIARLLEGILETHPGVVAISEGKLVGYLTGFAKIPYFKGISVGVYVPEWAHSVENGPGKEKVFQSMYDTISRNWVYDGCFTHAVTFFAFDTTLRDVLYWSGFGLFVVDAMRAINQGDVVNNNELGSEIAIRNANDDDLEELIRLNNELVTYLSRSPTFLFAERKAEPETAKAFLDQNAISVVAERDGRVLACIRGTEQKENACTIVQDASVMGIDFAYTDPSVRGTGIGRRILQVILKWGKSKHKTGCAVDFESANVLGRAFWLKHFRAVCFSAIRHVDPRVIRTCRNQ